jgi:hypothetical protein
MKFPRIRGRNAVITNLITGSILIAMVVYRLNIPWSEVASAAGMTLLVIALLIIPAALVTLVIVLIKHYKNKRED